MATIQQQTTQLEFHQAMADFKTMFPAMDDDVIEVMISDVVPSVHIIYLYIYLTFIL